MRAVRTFEDWLFDLPAWVAIVLIPSLFIGFAFVVALVLS